MIPEIWPKPFKHIEHVRPFLLTLCTIISLCVVAISYYLYNRNDKLLIEHLKEQAVNYAGLIMRTKAWNADYGGVYVLKSSKVESNSHLKELGIDPDVKAENGKVFTVRNHAIMIGEISRKGNDKENISFRVTSLKPLATENSPDPLEREGLMKLAQGAGEFFRFDNIEGKQASFRYLQPLYVDQSCLECHSAQGYRLGDIIGAISISIPAADDLQEARHNKSLVTLSAILIVGFLVGITYFLTWRLVIRLDEVQHRLKKLASIDELTNIRNRRTIMKRLGDEFQRATRLDEPFCLIVLDIDHFKNINDTYGHPFGDRVLKQVADLMRKDLRRYDILGRIGGEEFLILSPGTHLEEAVHLAERVISTVRESRITDGDKEIRITMSAGVTALQSDDSSVETLLKRADDALYEAKGKGRDRVIAA